VEVREQLFAQKLAAAVLALPTSILRLLDTRLASLREDFITKHTAIGSPNISKTQKAAEMRRFKRVSDEYHEAVKMYNLYLERDNASKEEQKRRPQAVWEECKNVDYMGDFPWTAGTQSDGNVPHAVRQHASKLLMKSNRLKEEFVLLGAEVKDSQGGAGLHHRAHADRARKAPGGHLLVGPGLFATVRAQALHEPP
jgi:Na+/phosphate symporter